MLRDVYILCIFEEMNAIPQEKLRMVRKQKGFSQQDMAFVIGTVTSNYLRKERGEVKIYVEEWEKLGKKLGVPVDEIIEEIARTPSEFEESSDYNFLESNINYLKIPGFFLETQKKIYSFT